ncbi:unnamed protein product [Rotaria sp. Silwood1]|nr:unnamed protein product [Rotaria sp. Silwood1]
MCCCCGDWMYPSENVLKIVYYSGGYNYYHNHHPCRPSPAARRALPSTFKQQLESLLGQYTNDDEISLRMLIEQTYVLMFENNKSSSEFNAPKEASECTKSIEGTVKQKTTQQLLNDIIDQFDALLAEMIADEDDLIRFDIVKIDLRQLFIQMEKNISTLENDVGVLKSRVLALEEMESNINVIQMGNIAFQLLNKMIRYIKPGLSKRAARDERIYSLQGEEKFPDLTDLIKKYDQKLTIFDLARSINALKKQRVENAHDEHPMSSDEIDSILTEFISGNDQYLSQQATVVVRFLKILAGHLNEPLIVDLG